MPNKLGISSRSLPNKLGICIIELGINKGHAFPDQAQRVQGKPTVYSLQFPTLLKSLLLSLALYRRNRGSLTTTPSPCLYARNNNDIYRENKEEEVDELFQYLEERRANKAISYTTINLLILYTNY